MTTEQILDGNKLIAEFFTGETFFNHSILIHGFSDESDLFFDSQLKFHSSWDWLMPVIGKISNGCEEPEELDGLKYALLTNNINESWRFVVEFIKWYNNK